MPTLVLTVTGMSCGGCSGSVENVVKKVPGVAEVKAEFQPTNKVTVTGEGEERAMRTLPLALSPLRGNCNSAASSAAAHSAALLLHKLNLSLPSGHQPASPHQNAWPRTLFTRLCLLMLPVLAVVPPDYDTMAIKEAIEKAGFKVEG
eukprot:6193885-Pleurochrysis_carterae.AAC.1